MFRLAWPKLNQKHLCTSLDHHEYWAITRIRVDFSRCFHVLFGAVSVRRDIMKSRRQIFELKGIGAIHDDSQ
ncbi:MAG: hypothetical protein ACK4PI_05355 [Tepidisphaerales bacterium]